jgi:hypothetical protein
MAGFLAWSYDENRKYRGRAQFQCSCVFASVCSPLSRQYINETTATMDRFKLSDRVKLTRKNVPGVFWFPGLEQNIAARVVEVCKARFTSTYLR